ncbi:MAG: phosphoenolpyruvate--protein phosphotransferase, partial [Anaerolineaceae bacterium]
SKAMQVPAAAGIFATGVEGLNGQIIVLDGQAGTVLIDSDPQTLERYRALALEDGRKAEQHLQIAAQPAFSKDNHLFLINANISSLDEAQTAFGRYGADGIGLFRTEYLFLGRKKPPSEEEQYQYCLSILELAGGKPVTARTVDLGGDKTVDYLATADEANPFLGLRGTRLALANAQLLRNQICALLRAGAIGHLKIMFPLISTVPEAKQARMLVEECKSELRRRNLPFNPDIQTGVMIETPASAVIADFLLQEFDFCSIGTNDLVQYTLAADRTNPVVAGYADALDPAMIRLIAAVIRTAHQAGKPVSLCGELAADPIAVTLLAGLGLDEFSLNAPGIPLIKDRTRAVSLTEACQIAAHALTLPSAVEVRAYLLSEGMR